ncbi:MAG: phosphoglycerate mutase family protein [Candidatus Woesearchaeota archaeon]
MRLFLIRHGHTEIQEGEAKLSEKGVLQSKELAKKLKKLKIDKVYTSDLERAKETAKEYSENFVEDKRLREVYRVLVGGPKKEGASPNRELEDKKRADDFLDEIIENEGNFAIFCHGNFIRYFLNKIIKSKKNLWKNLVLDNCSVSIIEKNKDGLFIKGINLKGDFEENIKDSENVYLE